MSIHNSFRSLLACALVSLCALSNACSSGQKAVITKQQVSAFLEEMDEAARKRDVDTVIANLSEDVQIKVTIEGFGPTQTLIFNRDQYKDYSKQGFGAVEAYEYKRGDTVIKVEPDGQSAFIADEIFETTTIGGQTIRSVARGTAFLKLENGRLVIARSEAVAHPLQPVNKARPASF